MGNDIGMNATAVLLGEMEAEGEATRIAIGVDVRYSGYAGRGGKAGGDGRGRGGEVGRGRELFGC